MRKSITLTLAAIGLGAMVQVPLAQADDDKQGIREIMRNFRLNVTRAEVGLSASGIVGADYLHGAASQSTGNSLVGQSSSAAPAQSSAAADSAAAYSSSQGAAADAAASSSAAAYTDSGAGSAAAMVEDSGSAPSYSGSGGGGGGSSYSGGGSSYSGGGKGVVGGKEVMSKAPAVVMPEPAPLFTIALDGGYQSMYYHLGINRVLNGTFNATASDTDVWYGGVTASFMGLSAGVKYVRGTQTLETRFSINPRVFATYEEWVYFANYSLDILPDGHLNITGGYTGISFPEETFYNHGRFDDFYVRVGNASIPYFRPSVAWHYLDSDSPLTAGTTAPGVKVADGNILVAQVDGMFNLPAHLGVPFDVTYYAQWGFDDDYNEANTDYDHGWTQVGVGIPIYIGNVTITPNWNYNDLVNDAVLVQNDEHFWGVNVSFSF